MNKCYSAPTPFLRSSFFVRPAVSSGLGGRGGGGREGKDYRTYVQVFFCSSSSISFLKETPLYMISSYSVLSYVVREFR